jgi:hypothetical protein
VEAGRWAGVDRSVKCKMIIKRFNLAAEIEMLKKLEFDNWQELDGLKKSWESVWKAQE